MIDRMVKIDIGFCLFVCSLIILFVYLSSCSSVPRHKALTFFFDGVPDPAAIKAVHDADSAAAKAKFTGKNKIPTREEIAKSFFHVPYKQKQCSVCHDQGTMGKSKNPQPALCYKCHEDFSKKYKKVHGPVAGGFCTECHNPHMADNKNFLVRKSRQLCLYCHDSGQVLKNETHRKTPDANCVDCHNPHGADDQRMLK